MAGASKTNSFGTFLETIEQAAPPAAAPAPQPGPSAMTDVSRRVLHLLATGGPATVTQLREQAGAETDDALAELAANGFVEKHPGRTVRFALTAQGQAVVKLLSP